LIAHIIISTSLFLSFVIGITNEKSERIYIFGGIGGCLFLAHIVMIILMKIGGIL